MSVRSRVPQQQICSRIDHVLRIGTQINAVNLPHSTPVEGVWRRIFRRNDKEYQENKKEFELYLADFELNKKEFSLKAASDWFDYVTAIRNFRVSWIREGLSSLYKPDDSPDEYLLDMKLFFRGELTSLVDVAKKYYNTEMDEETKKRRWSMYLRIVSYKKQYEKRKQKAAMEKELDSSSS